MLTYPNSVITEPNLHRNSIESMALHSCYLLCGQVAYWFRFFHKKKKHPVQLRTKTKTIPPWSVVRRPSTTQRWWSTGHLGNQLITCNPIWFHTNCSEVFAWNSSSFPGVFKSVSVQNWFLFIDLDWQTDKYSMTDFWAQLWSQHSFDPSWLSTFSSGY